MPVKNKKGKNQKEVDAMDKKANLPNYEDKGKQMPPLAKAEKSKKKK
jgi:hypothetical protein